MISCRIIKKTQPNKNRQKTSIFYTSHSHTMVWGMFSSEQGWFMFVSGAQRRKGLGGSALSHTQSTGRAPRVAALLAGVDHWCPSLTDTLHYTACLGLPGDCTRFSLAVSSALKADIKPDLYLIFPFLHCSVLHLHSPILLPHHLLSCCLTTLLSLVLF